MRPKLAMYWAASCGGCEVALLNVGEFLFTLDGAFEIVFCPMLADFKYSDLEVFPEGFIDICLFNGAIRSSENETMAALLRERSKVLVAFGSCAEEGCIPALSNLTSSAATFDSVFLKNPSTRNLEGTTPQTDCSGPEGELRLPVFYDNVRALHQVVEVEYSVPGCPPEPARIREVLELLLGAMTGAEEMPKKGALGCEELALCDQCHLQREEKRVSRVRRPHEIEVDPETCLLDQGILCMGPATRGGCGALCPQVGMGCRGCYGLPPGVEDQGAAMVSVVASMMDAGNVDQEEDDLRAEVEHALRSVVDPAGTFYRFSMARSLLWRARGVEQRR